MNPIIKNVLAIIAGCVVGGIVNMSLVILGHEIFPIEGFDPNDSAAFIEIMPTLDFKYFIFPFLAHAFGTLVGALIAWKVAATHKMKISIVIGVFFLFGGVYMASLLSFNPTWFAVVDILIAYIPMAWIGGKLAERM